MCDRCFLSISNTSFRNEREEIPFQGILYNFKAVLSVSLDYFWCVPLSLLLASLALCYSVLSPYNLWNWSRWDWLGSQPGISRGTSMPNKVTSYLNCVVPAWRGCSFICAYCRGAGWREVLRGELFSSGLGIWDPGLSGHSQSSQFSMLWGFLVLHVNDCFTHSTSLKFQFVQNLSPYWGLSYRPDGNIKYTVWFCC